MSTFIFNSVRSMKAEARVHISRLTNPKKLETWIKSLKSVASTIKSQTNYSQVELHLIE